ncbi:uncharacterized protein [Anabrus simplex]|uniref:uncharacterized protein n=1 Tax=Anabrus simplex TaxID=316456 RepID=UPI0035A2B1D4
MGVVGQAQYIRIPQQRICIVYTSHLIMKLLVVLCATVALASAKPASVTPVVYSAHLGVVDYSAIEPIVTQYHAQNVLGQASYGHVSGLQAHHAVQDAAGNKVGSYSHIAPNGQVISTNYVADGSGYRAVSNGLPVGAQETPEVLAARNAHLAEVEAVKSRSRRAAQVADTPARTSRLGSPVVSVVSTPVVHQPALTYAIPFYQHLISKREANPQTPASTTNFKGVPHVPIVTSHVVTPHVVSHPAIAYSYPHVIAKREANPQTPASTTNLKIVPHVPVIASQVVTPHPVVAYNYPHVIAKRAAQTDTPAHTARLPASPVVVPSVYGVHPILGIYNPVVAG